MAISGRVRFPDAAVAPTWDLTWRLDDDPSEEGIVLRNVHVDGKLVLYKASMPIARVHFDGVCPSYKAKLNFGSAVPQDDCAGQLVCVHEEDGDLVIRAVFAQGEERITQIWRLRRHTLHAGFLTNRRGCDAYQRHDVYWRFDVDLGDADNDELWRREPDPSTIPTPLPHAVLFDSPEFRGNHRHVVTSIDAYPASLAILAGNWRARGAPRGDELVLGPGLYPNIRQVIDLVSLAPTPDAATTPGLPLQGHAILFDQITFHGEHRHVFNAESNLVNTGFSDRAASMAVLSGNWRLYSDAAPSKPYDYVFSPNLYGYLTSYGVPADRVSAATMTAEPGGFPSPPDGDLIVFTQPAFGGDHKHVFTSEPDLNRDDDPLVSNTVDDDAFDSNIRSAIAFSGAWSLYDDFSFAGHHLDLAVGLHADLDALGIAGIRSIYLTQPPAFPPDWFPWSREIAWIAERRRDGEPILQIQDRRTGSVAMLTAGAFDGSVDPAFLTHDVWVTRYSRSEDRDGAQGTATDDQLDSLVDGDLIDGKDLVVWYAAHQVSPPPSARHSRWQPIFDAIERGPAISFAPR